MKKSFKWVLVGSAVVVSASTLAAEGQVDYSKCQEFLTPGPGAFGLKA